MEQDELYGGVGFTASPPKPPAATEPPRAPLRPGQQPADISKFSDSEVEAYIDMASKFGNTSQAASFRAALDARKASRQPVPPLEQVRRAQAALADAQDRLQKSEAKQRELRRQLREADAEVAEEKDKVAEAMEVEKTALAALQGGESGRPSLSLEALTSGSFDLASDILDLEGYEDLLDAEQEELSGRMKYIKNELAKSAATLLGPIRDYIQKTQNEHKQMLDRAAKRRRPVSQPAAPTTAIAGGSSASGGGDQGDAAAPPPAGTLLALPPVPVEVVPDKSESPAEEMAQQDKK